MLHASAISNGTREQFKIYHEWISHSDKLSNHLIFWSVLFPGNEMFRIFGPQIFWLLIFCITRRFLNAEVSNDTENQRLENIQLCFGYAEKTFT